MRVCVPVRVNTASEAKQCIGRIHGLAHSRGGRDQVKLLIELWLDRLSNEEIVECICYAKLPILVVCRAPNEKGHFRGSEEARTEKLLTALCAGACFVDCSNEMREVHLKKIVYAARKSGARVILSTHFWNSTPKITELLRIVEKGHRRGADIVKIATKVKRWSDNVILFELTTRIAAERKKGIILGMGEKGKISRWGCPLLGSYLTFAALDKAHATALGQMTLKEMTNNEIAPQSGVE
jgi:3-dehydroquinate dehydratase type I